MGCERSTLVSFCLSLQWGQHLQERICSYKNIFFALRVDLFGIAKIHGGVLPIHLKGVYCDFFSDFFIYL